MGRGTSGMPQAIPGGGNTGGESWSQAPNIQEPETLKEALGEKGRPMSMMNATTGANPYWDETYTYAEFNMNCQRCVIANEARRRGYDVVAQPTFEGDTMGAAAYINPSTGVRNSYWMGSFQGAKPIAVGKSTADATRNALESQMQDFGSGSRAIMQVQWKGGGGHVLSVENHAGKVYYVDPQVGARYNAKQLFSEINTSRTQITRVDNLRFSSRARKMVEPSGSRR